MDHSEYLRIGHEKNPNKIIQIPFIFGTVTPMFNQGESIGD